MNSFDFVATQKVFQLMEQSHTGKNGDSHGCMKNAALLAIDIHGTAWIAPTRGVLNAVSTHEFLKRAVKLSCPPNCSNPDKYVRDFLGYATKHASGIKPN